MVLIGFFSSHLIDDEVGFWRFSPCEEEVNPYLFLDYLSYNVILSSIELRFKFTQRISLK